MLKFYSDVTKSFYSSAEEAEKAEAAVIEQKKKREEDLEKDKAALLKLCDETAQLFAKAKESDHNLRASSTAFMRKYGEKEFAKVFAEDKNKKSNDEKNNEDVENVTDLIDDILDFLFSPKFRD